MHLRTLASWISILLIGWLALPVAAQHASPVAPAETAGMSAERLARIGPLMQAYVDDEHLAGIKMIVARRGKVVYYEDYGLRDIETSAPMTEDTIFRIYSMTKPITSVAVLMLYEEGRFRLNDPVARYIPAFKNLQVYDADDASMRAALRRPMTIRDLLTHTSGLTYGFFSETPVDTLYRRNGLFARGGDLEDFVGRLSDLPLLHQPGTTWHYSVSTDVLGYLVEVVSGQTLDVFFKERIFDPLGMKDTSFDVPPEKMDRFAANYHKDDNGRLEAVDAGATSQFAAPVRFFSGGGGLVSTAGDYMRFAQMLLNGGTLDGTRLLSPKTVELMTANHLDEDYAPGWGFGLGVRVCTDVARTQTLGSEGTFGWSGMANTYFFIDPEEELIAMVWTQFLPYGAYPIQNQFKVAVYQAIVD